MPTSTFYHRSRPVERNAVCALAGVQSRPGTYALMLSSATNAAIRVGRLGNLRLQMGFYVYVGSALGPGGVRARLAHHARSARRPHWHIDYLRAHTTLEEVWFCYDRKSREHHLARCFAAMRTASVPMAGFGSSDCDCESHLFFFEKYPVGGDFVRRYHVLRREEPEEEEDDDGKKHDDGEEDDDDNEDDDEGYSP